MSRRPECRYWYWLLIGIASGKRCQAFSIIITQYIYEKTNPLITERLAVFKINRAHRWSLLLLSIYPNRCNSLADRIPSARWRHQMEKLSALLALCAGNSPVTGEFPHKGQWRGALMFSSICVLNKAGDLRRHHAHYDVIVMDFSYVTDTISLSDSDKML